MVINGIDVPAEVLFVIGIWVVFFLLWFLRWLFMPPNRRQLALEPEPVQEPRRIEPEPVQPQARRQARPAISLSQLTLAMETRAGRLRFDRFVHTDEVVAIRPMAIVKVSRKSLVGRKVALKLELRNQFGTTCFLSETFKPLTKGDNRFVPRESLRVDDTMVGNWTIVLFLGEKPWAEVQFKISNARPEDFKNIVGPDGDLRDPKKNVDEVADLTYMSVDDLLR